MNRFNSYAHYIKNKFGVRVQKISVDGGFTCPNRDGTKGVGGCTYCNNLSFGPALKYGVDTIKEQIEVGVKKMCRRYKTSSFMVYFQNYSNTYAPTDKLIPMYEEALNFPSIVGLSIGTRVDCLEDDLLLYLQNISKKYEIVLELGLESVFEETLSKINRGHTVSDFFIMHEKVKSFGIKTCAHLILGFPWEDAQVAAKEAAKRLSEAKVDFVKVHQLHVVKNSLMGNEYRKSPWKVKTPQEYIEDLIVFLEYLSPDIIIQRLFGEADKDILLSEHVELSLSELNSLLLLEMEKRETFQGRLYGK